MIKISFLFLSRRRNYINIFNYSHTNKTLNPNLSKKIRILLLIYLINFTIYKIFYYCKPNINIIFFVKWIIFNEKLILENFSALYIKCEYTMINLKSAV